MLGITNVSNAPSIVLKDTVVSSWTSGSYNGYSYRASIPITGVTADTIAEVTFSQAQAESGNYSSVCTTYDGGLYVYSKVNTQITIPSIIIHSIVETYYEMDNSPVSGSTNAITSGGVFTALTPEMLYDGTNVQVIRIGKIVHVTMYGQTSALSIPNMPQPKKTEWSAVFTGDVTPNGAMWVSANSTTISMNFKTNVASYGQMTYIAN